MKIVHVVAPASVGGLERVVGTLAALQKARGHELHLFALTEPEVAEPQLLGEMRDAGVSVYVAAFPARSFLQQRHALQTMCAALQPDLLHSHGYLPDVLTASLSNGLGIKRVSTVHGFTGGAWRNRFYELLQRQSYRRFDVVIAVSDKLASDLDASNPSHGKVRKVVNAFSPRFDPLPPSAARSLLGISDGVFSIGWVGRISHEKGPDVLIRALTQLVDLNFRLDIIGSGMERTDLEHLSEKLGLSSRIVWHGEMQDASRLLRAFDVVVLSSRTEGTPIVLLEAMHAGVPIVATSVGGIPSMLSPLEALLVPSENPVALASAIRAVGSSRVSSVERARRANQRLAKDFAAEPWIDSYDRIYRQLIPGAAA